MGPPLLQKNELLDNRFEVEAKIGEGTFSEIYRARDVTAPNGHPSQLVAIKVEKEEMVLKFETSVLRKLQENPWVCRHIRSGVHGTYPYLAMELLGDNLSDLRRRQKGQRFSLGTTLHLGRQMLQALERCHSFGFLHRDVKPSNFAVGYGEDQRRCYIIDFGLCKKYLTDTGEIVPARKNAQFRGTSVYASVYAHQHKDLGRRDDLWSLVYVLTEFLDGDLPWRSITDREAVRVAKEQYNRNPEQMMRNVALPEELKEVMMYLRSLDFEDAPDYTYLHGQLAALSARIGRKEEDALDWESGDPSTRLGPATKNETAAAATAAATGNKGAADKRGDRSARGDRGGEREREREREREARDGGERGSEAVVAVAMTTAYRPGGSSKDKEGGAAGTRAAAGGGGGGGWEDRSGSGGGGSGGREDRSARICFDVLTRLSCAKEGCALFHPPVNPTQRAHGLCLDYISRKCHKGDRCSRYHWTPEEEAAYRKSGAVPQNRGRGGGGGGGYGDGERAPPPPPMRVPPPAPPPGPGPPPPPPADAAPPPAAEVAPPAAASPPSKTDPLPPPPDREGSPPLANTVKRSVTNKLDKLIAAGKMPAEAMDERMWKILHFVPEHAAHDAINAFCNDKRGPGGGGGKKRESLVDLMQKHYDEAAALRLKQQGMPSKPLSHPAILAYEPEVSYWEATREARELREGAETATKDGKEPGKDESSRPRNGAAAGGGTGGRGGGDDRRDRRDDRNGSGGGKRKRRRSYEPPRDRDRIDRGRRSRSRSRSRGGGGGRSPPPHNWRDGPPPPPRERHDRDRDRARDRDRDRTRDRSRDRDRSRRERERGRSGRPREGRSEGEQTRSGSSARRQPRDSSPVDWRNGAVSSGGGGGGKSPARSWGREGDRGRGAAPRGSSPVGGSSSSVAHTDGDRGSHAHRERGRAPPRDGAPGGGGSGSGGGGISGTREEGAASLSQSLSAAFLPQGGGGGTADTPQAPPAPLESESSDDEEPLSVRLLRVKTGAAPSPATAAAAATPARNARSAAATDDPDAAALEEEVRLEVEAEAEAEEEEAAAPEREHAQRHSARAGERDGGGSGGERSRLRHRRRDNNHMPSRARGDAQAPLDAGEAEPEPTVAAAAVDEGEVEVEEMEVDEETHDQVDYEESPRPAPRHSAALVLDPDSDAASESFSSLFKPDGSDEEEEDQVTSSKAAVDSGAAAAAAAAVTATPPKPSAGRPGKHQMQYLCHLNWHHYSHPRLGKAVKSPSAETSVMKAFLNALEAVASAERRRSGAGSGGGGGSARNCLRELARVPHRSKLSAATGPGEAAPKGAVYARDAEGAAYSTTLDRNKYGADDQFLSTCLHQCLRELVGVPQGLCPQLVTVELIDTKAGTATLVEREQDFPCVCAGGSGSGVEDGVRPRPTKQQRSHRGGGSGGSGDGTAGDGDRQNHRRSRSGGGGGGNSSGDGVRAAEAGAVTRGGSKGEAFFEELAGSMNSRELKGLGNGAGVIISGKRRARGS